MWTVGNVEGMKVAEGKMPPASGMTSTSSIFFTTKKKLWSRSTLGSATFQPPISTADTNNSISEEKQSMNAPSALPKSLFNRRPFSTSSSNIINPLKMNALSGSRESLLAQETSTELREVDFVNELWNTLIPRKGSSKFFSVDHLGNFKLLEGLRLEESCMKFGQNYVSDVLSNCFECRNKLLAIEKFVCDKDASSNIHQYQSNAMSNSYMNGLNRLSPFLHILIRPINIVLKRFLEEMETSTQRHLIHHRDLAGFSSFLFGFKPKVEKVYNFFKPLFCNSKMKNSTSNDFEVENVDLIWNKFIVGLNTCSDLEDELPIWQKLYKELIHVLGEYFDEICRQRFILPSFSVPLMKSPLLTRCSSTLSLTNNNGCYFTAANTYGRCSSENFEDDISSIGGTTTNAGNTFSGVHFAHLWTPKVRSSLQQAFRFSEKIFASIHASGGSKKSSKKDILQEHTFQEIFQETYCFLQKVNNIKSENPFKFLINLLEHSTLAYKEQFTDCIFKGVHKDNKLKTTLQEIQELYTFRAFANHVSSYYNDFGSVSNDRSTFDWADEMSKALDLLLEKTQSSASKLNGENNNLANTLPVKAKNEWKVNISSNSAAPWKFRLSCNLDWPLGCVLGTDLFATLNNCLEKCQILFYAHKCALILSLKKSTIDSTWNSLEARRKRFLARSLLECITVVYSVLRQHLESLIEQRAAQILRANSLEEIDKCVSDWITEFGNVLDTDTHHTGSYIHPAVEALCDLIQKFYNLEFKIESRALIGISNSATRRAESSFNAMIPSRFKINMRESQILSSTPKSRGSHRETTEEPVQWRDPSSVPGLMFGESRSMSNLNLDSDRLLLNRSTSFSHENDNERTMRLVEKWLKSLRNVRTMLSAAAENPVASLDSANIGYIIAFLCPKNV